MAITRRRLSHEGIYWGKDRNLNIAELLCASCHRWYTTSPVLATNLANWSFYDEFHRHLKNLLCNWTGVFQTKPAFVQICVTAIANLQQASLKDGSNRQRFSKEGEIIPFIDMHPEGMTPPTRCSSLS